MDMLGVLIYDWNILEMYSNRHLLPIPNYEYKLLIIYYANVLQMILHENIKWIGLL